MLAPSAGGVGEGFVEMAMLMLMYVTASFAHFAHNATYVDAYPNFPAWISPALVYAVWIAETAFGITGYVMARRGIRAAGLAIVAVYAMLGFDGFAHYPPAPMAHHTGTMNLTIGAEATAGAALFVVVIRKLTLGPRSDSRTTL